MVAAEFFFHTPGECCYCCCAGRGMPRVTCVPVCYMNRGGGFSPAVGSGASGPSPCVPSGLVVFGNPLAGR